MDIRIVEGLPKSSVNQRGSRDPVRPTPKRNPYTLGDTPQRLATLKGRCFSVSQGTYNYEFCPFKNITQRDTRSTWNPFWGILGIWETFAASEDGGEQEYVHGLYTDGTECGTRSRRATITFKCSTKHALGTIEEPATCTYVGVFECPEACDDFNLTGTAAIDGQGRSDAEGTATSPSNDGPLQEEDRDEAANGNDDANSEKAAANEVSATKVETSVGDDDSRVNSNRDGHRGKSVENAAAISHTEEPNDSSPYQAMSDDTNYDAAAPSISHTEEGTSAPAEDTASESEESLLRKRVMMLEAKLAEVVEALKIQQRKDKDPPVEEDVVVSTEEKPTKKVKKKTKKKKHKKKKKKTKKKN